jgi:hemerythrin superfamily protein
MSIIDKVVSAVTPIESDDARREARAKAKRAAQPGDWLSMVVDHHEQIEAAFAAVKSASTAATRTAAQKRLGILLTGHSNAEESVIYPGLTKIDEKGHATSAYTEQAAAKTQMALLEGLAPMTQEYLDKLEHIRGAVAHHVYEEENSWFPELKEKAPAADQVKLTERYHEEFSRYVGRKGDLEADDTRLRASGSY